MSLFANLFDQSKGTTPVTELLTARNPFFSAGVDASGSPQDLRAQKKARKGERKYENCLKYEWCSFGATRCPAGHFCSLVGCAVHWTVVT